MPSYDWEIINSFLNSSNAAPSWVNCNSTWGRFDENTTSWTGAVGQVRKQIFHEFSPFVLKIEQNIADIAVEGFGCNYMRSKVLWFFGLLFLLLYCQGVWMSAWHHPQAPVPILKVPKEGHLHVELHQPVHSYKLDVHFAFHGSCSYFLQDICQYWIKVWIENK